MATFELYRMSTIGIFLMEALDQMVDDGMLRPKDAIQVLAQFDKINLLVFSSKILLVRFVSMTEALETPVKSKVSIKGHLHTNRFCDNVWTFILKDALIKSENRQETVSIVKIVACDSKLLKQ